MKFDDLVAKIIKECKADGEPVTKEEAEEMAKMEMGTKEIKRYEKAETANKPKQKREIKKDEEKIKIIEKIYNFLLTNGFETAIIKNEQREITFGDYSLTLTKHRTKKER